MLWGRELARLPAAPASCHPTRGDTPRRGAATRLLPQITSLLGAMTPDTVRIDLQTSQYAEACDKLGAGAAMLVRGRMLWASSLRALQGLGVFERAMARRPGGSVPSPPQPDPLLHPSPQMTAVFPEGLAKGHESWFDFEYGTAAIPDSLLARWVETRRVARRVVPGHTREPGPRACGFPVPATRAVVLTALVPSGGAMRRPRPPPPPLDLCCRWRSPAPEPGMALPAENAYVPKRFPLVCEEEGAAAEEGPFPEPPLFLEDAGGLRCALVQVWSGLKQGWGLGGMWTEERWPVRMARMRVRGSRGAGRGGAFEAR